MINFSEETDNLAAPREITVSIDSVRRNHKGLLHQVSPIVKQKPSLRFKEFEDYKCGGSGNNNEEGEDQFSFKTQPDAVEEDSDSYKEMKQIFDNIRYSYNNQNINSPVSKQHFAQLLHSNSHRKMNEKISSTTNAAAQTGGESNYFSSAKRLNQQTAGVSP